MALVRSIVVSVYRDDIKSGVPNSCTSCPVALATARAFGHRFRKYTVDVMVGSAEIDLSLRVPEHPESTRYFTVAIPEGVQDWIERFDKHGDAVPIKFALTYELPA